VKALRAFLYVQHLLGIGHLRRAVTLANALAAEGIDVTLASGGFEVSGMKLTGVRFVQLPPAAAADSSFRVLVDADGNPVDERWRTYRRETLLDAWRAADPHAVIVELYPFGRRQMRFELIPLLEAAVGAARRPLIVCSVRDIIGAGQKDLSRQDEMLEVFERYFDHLLVHGDPSVIPFGRTFRHAASLESRLSYTGYVVDGAGAALVDVHGGGPGEGEVVVSAGGGAVGMRLLETAIRARPFSLLGKRTWRILGGINSAAADLAILASIADVTGQGRVVVERARSDFPTLLANCALSVSQGGYNTMMEIIQARARAVVVPFAGGAETEQTLRARWFADRGLIHMVEEHGLTPESLAAAIDSAAARPRPAQEAIGLDGARRTAALIGGWTSELEW
jgi:predicted glycosyltransferase